MEKFLIFVSIFVAASCFHPLSDEFIDEINKKATTWTAGRNFNPNTDMSYIKAMMGVHPDSDEHRAEEYHHDEEGIKDLPASFDARVQWSNCPIINDVRDQGGCGCCWALAPASAISDRICIMSNGSLQIRISGQNLASCCKLCGLGCLGGKPPEAWKFWVTTGLVSGGEYGSLKGCQPFVIEPCDHAIADTTAKPKCVAMTTSLKCLTNCTNTAYSVPYISDKKLGGTSYSIAKDVAQIQMEIFKNGPVVASFAVLEDFLNYKNGVYQNVTGMYLGGHAVKVIGWGNENSTDYWLVMNSWNKDWGDSGLFKILRGVDLLGIESQISAGLPPK